MHAIPAVEEDAADQIANIVFKGTSNPEHSDEVSTGRGGHVLRDGGDTKDDKPSPAESYDEPDGR